MGAGWGQLPRLSPYLRGFWFWDKPHFPSTSPSSARLPPSLPPAVGPYLCYPLLRASSYPRGISPPPPVGSGLGQDFLPSPSLPGPLLPPRAIWLMVRTVRQGALSPWGPRWAEGGGEVGGQATSPPLLSPLPLPNKGSHNAGEGVQPGTQGGREEERAVWTVMGRDEVGGSTAPPLPSPSGQG